MKKRLMILVELIVGTLIILILGLRPESWLIASVVIMLMELYRQFQM